jgi:hypothetical protein
VDDAPASPAEVKDGAVMVNRRRFLGQVVLGLLTAPVAAEAQQAGKVYRVGFITPLSGSPEPPTLRAFRQGPRALDYVERRNVLIETRFANAFPT